MNKRVGIILVNYKHYADKYLAECLFSINKQDYLGEIKLYIVDNASTDESLVYLQKNAPEAKIITNENNDGFAKGNNDGIKVAIADACDYIILFNMDTVVDSRAVSELVNMAESDDKIGAVQSRLMLFDNKNLINSLGNSTHFLGFGFCDDYQKEYSNSSTGVKNIFYPSGAAVLFKTEVLKKVSLFDEVFWMYNEDQDLGWRIWLAGYTCVLASDSIVYHKYEFSKSISKYYFMDRNRIITALKNYTFFSLIILFPAFLIMEIGLLFFSIFNGWLAKKIKVYLYFLNPVTWNYIWRERKIIQKNRVIKDKDLIAMLSGKISYQEVDSFFLRLANFFLNIYFIIFKSLLKFFNV